jgi:hypothetical protein
MKQLSRNRRGNETMGTKTSIILLIALSICGSLGWKIHWDNVKKLITVTLLAIFSAFTVSCSTNHVAEYPLHRELMTCFDPYCVGEATAVVPLPPDHLRTRLGRIGVVSACYSPETTLQTPMTKGGAASHGAVGGAVLPVVIGIASLAWPLMAAGIVLAPVGATVGSIVGMVEGETSEKIKELEDALKSCLATPNLQESLRERVLTTAKEETPDPFLFLDAQGPRSLGEEITYDSVTYRDIDTVLEIGVRKCELKGKAKEMNPDMILIITANAKLIRLKDGEALYTGDFIYGYQSSIYKFSDWGSENGRLFKEELDRALTFIAKKIVEVTRTIQEPSGIGAPDTSKSE